MVGGDDVFLGWTGDSKGPCYYSGQLRDMQTKIDLEKMTKGGCLEYLEICGHARTADAAIIGG
jgi:hypothetical protein